jgi:hypothetical protein
MMFLASQQAPDIQLDDENEFNQLRKSKKSSFLLKRKQGGGKQQHH